MLRPTLQSPIAKQLKAIQAVQDGKPKRGAKAAASAKPSFFPARPAKHSPVRA